MIVTLIPFLLAARLDSPDLLSKNHGPEVTYLVQNHATAHHSGDTDADNMEFRLRALLTCQSLNTSIFCNFHDVKVNSTPEAQNRRKLWKYIVDDSLTKKILLQDSVQIEYEKDGRGTVWVPVEVEPVGRAMINTLSRLLIVGLDLSKKYTGNSETPSDVSMGNCRTKYFTTRTAPAANHRNSPMNLFLLPRPQDSLSEPLEVAQMVEPKDCPHTRQAAWYSFWTAREMRTADPKDVETELNSAENFIIMNNHNFTSFSKVKSTIKNHKDNTKYIIDESISVSLQNINTPECRHCDDDDSKLQEDHSSEEKNVFMG